MATITELMNEMQDKYYLRSSFDQIERSVKLFNELDGAMLDRPASQRNESIYLRTVRLLVNQHIAAATYFASPVDLKNLNNSVRNLLQDFENIMQARHEETAPNTPRVPFNGEYAQAMDIIAACAAPYNKPIYEVWADRIMKGSIDLSVVRADVNNIYNNSLGVDLSTNEAAKENVEEAVMMYHAIKEVASERSTFWKILPWNWVQAYRESKLLDDLSAHVAQYEQRGVAINSVRNNAEPIFGKYFDNMISNDKAFYASEMSRAKTNANVSREPMDSIDISNNAPTKVNAPAKQTPISETVMKWRNNEENVDEFITELSTSLPKGPAIGRVKPMIRTNLENMFMKPAQKANVEFDKHNGKEKDTMVLLTKTLYKNALDVAHKCGFLKPEAQIAAAQVLVDNVMRKVTPAGFHKEFSEFANGYVLKNAKEFNKEMPTMYQFKDADYAKANEVYLATVPQKIEVQGIENPVSQIADPVVNAPSINPLTINSSK